MRTRPFTAPAEDPLDLNPLIDVITILLVFFIIGGRLSRPADGITVPPGRTAQAGLPADAGLVVLSVAPAEAGGGVVVTVGPRRFAVTPVAREGLDGLRDLLDRIWDAAPKATRDGVAVARTAIEIRADAAVPYREVQDLLALVADASPASAAPRAARRPFTDLRFTARPAGG